MAARVTAYIVACIVGVTLIAGLIVGAQREDDGAVDLIIVNARVYAGDGSNDLQDAVAVRGNKVLRVGSNGDVRRLRRAQTVVIDAKGGAVVPGFNDAHAHFITGGLSLDQASLLEATTLDAVKDTVRVWAEAHPERDWILGRGWSYQPFTGGLPTRQLLDTLVPDRPAYLIADDGRTGWANTKALKAAGITRQTKNPANGVVVKDARTGEPTGVLKETAMALMTRVTPQPTREDKLAAIRASLEDAHHLGVTSVQNAGGTPDDLELFDELRKRGELNVRVYQALTVDASLTEADLDRLEDVRARFADDPVLKTGAVILGPDGDPRFTPARLNEVVAMLDRREWQVMTSASSDAAVRLTLDAYEAAARANPAPARGRRHRIEHLDSIDPVDVPRFGKLGVVASFQPPHGELVWGSVSKAGGPLAFGSDWPMATLDPRPALDASETLSLRKAILAYTRDSAWASYDEQRKGTIARDMLADLVVFSEDIFAKPAPRLTDTTVAVTIVDGKVVYRRDTSESTAR
jgi:predicted amidohydrolase YtcJ